MMQRPLSHIKLQKWLGIGLLVIIFMLALVACGSNDEDEAAVKTVLIHNAVSGVFDPVVEGLQTTLTDMGFVEGENVQYVYSTSVDELVAAVEDEPDLIVSIPGSTVFASGVATGDIPVIFVPTNDPVGRGMVESISDPGGYTTGIMQGAGSARRFRLLLDMLVDADLIYVVFDSTHDISMDQVQDIEAIAAELNITLVKGDSPMGELDVTNQSIENVPPETDGIILVQGHSGGLTSGWPEAAIRRQIPLSAEGTMETVDLHGPLMSYGPDMYIMGKQAANQVQQVLKGTPTGDLPVEEAELVLTVDLRIAQMIGFEIPDTLLRQAAVVYREDTHGTLPALLDEGGSDETQMVSEGACLAQQSSPGGANAVCVTISCDQIEDGMIKYTQREEAEECPINEDWVGTCEGENFDTLFYDGEAASLKMGCGFSSGNWVEAE